MDVAWQDIRQFMAEKGIRYPEKVLDDDEWQEEEGHPKAGIRRLKGTFIWKMLKPVRVVYHCAQHLVSLLGRYGFSGALHAASDALHTEIERRRSSKHYVKSIMPTDAERKSQEETVFEKDVTFSILVPLYNTPQKYLRQMIESVQKQTYGKWELCLADGSDESHEYVGSICRELAAQDVRIRYEKLERNMGISGNTNHCIGMAHGDYICFFDHDDILHPCALYELMQEICGNGADFIYTDEATFLKDDLTKIVTYHFKPDFSIDNLLANNYICHFTSFDAKLLKKVGLFRDKYNGSQDHDMILRLTDAAEHIAHIPKVLYFWRSHPDSVSLDISSKEYAIKAGKNAVHDFLLSKGVEAKVESSPAFPTIYRIHYPIAGEPKVSIIIPNKDHVEDLALCLAAIHERTTYGNYEIIVVENNSTTKEIWEYYSLIEQLPNVCVVRWESEFNYSAINNYGATFATGEYLVLLNNDVEIRTRDWIQEMLMYAQRQDVGAVGAKLYYKNMTIQHAGVILGLGEHGIAGYSHAGEPRESVGYMGRLYFVQDVSAVTAACLMVGKKKYDQVGGLDEKLKVAYNDIDFCMKLRQQGYWNVFTPWVEAIHYESKTRGLDTEGGAVKRLDSEAGYMKEKWKRELEEGDPFYNPNMSLKRPWKMRYDGEKG